MQVLPFQIDPNELQLINDEVLLRSLQQYREALKEIDKEIDGHDPKLASEFSAIVKHYEAEAERRGLKV